MATHFSANQVGLSKNEAVMRIFLSVSKSCHIQYSPGLALASSQVANGYLPSQLATEQRAGVAKLATGFFWGV